MENRNRSPDRALQCLMTMVSRKVIRQTPNFQILTVIMMEVLLQILQMSAESEVALTTSAHETDTEFRNLYCQATIRDT